MTTTAHEGQFTAAPEPVREPMSREAILRRNIADAEKEMQRQAERAESYAETLRSIASYVGAGGYNADTVDAGVFEEKIRWGIGELIGMLDRANAELAKLAQQFEYEMAIALCKLRLADAQAKIDSETLYQREIDVRVEGGCNNTCTRKILGETCGYCRCPQSKTDAARSAK